MAGDTDNPRIWVDGDVYTAIVGSSEPTNTTSPWAAAWDALGLLSEDGLTESREEDSTDHYAWGGILVRTRRSKHKRTFVVSALEDNPVVQDVINPGSTTLTQLGITTRTVKVPEPNERMFGIELVDGEIIKRIVIPRGEVTQVGDTVYVDSQMQMRELTITVYPDETGVLYKEITDDPQAVVAS